MVDEADTDPLPSELVTADQLVEIMPLCPSAMKAVYALGISQAAREFGIDTVTRLACFLGQLAWECDELTAFEERSDGLRYEGRLDIGNTQPGDGPRFKGRGAIQTTGRKNYAALAAALGVDVVAQPELVAKDPLCFRGAGYFWQSHRLNEKADRGAVKEITQVVNGGLDGYDQRLAFTRTAFVVLGRGARLG